jgi:hypothetical protein
MRSVSSMKAYPVKEVLSQEKGHRNSHPKPFLLKLLMIGVLTTAQIAGPTPFPWPTPCIGIVQFLPP